MTSHWQLSAVLVLLLLLLLLTLLVQGIISHLLHLFTGEQLVLLLVVLS
jgi:hypothetical protein